MKIRGACCYQILILVDQYVCFITYPDWTLVHGTIHAMMSLLLLITLLLLVASSPIRPLSTPSPLLSAPPLMCSVMLFVFSLGADHDVQCVQMPKGHHTYNTTNMAV